MAEALAAVEETLQRKMEARKDAGGRDRRDRQAEMEARMAVDLNEVLVRERMAHCSATRLAEQTRAAEAAAQALMEELAAEGAAEEEAKKQTKKNEKAKKAKSKQARATAGGREDGGSKGGGGDAAAAAAAVATTSTGLSVRALTKATGRLAIDGNEEGKAQEKKEEGGQADGALSAPAAPMATPPPPSAHVDDDEEEEDDDEAFQNFLLKDAPLGLHCLIGICLLTDPVTAADGHTYQRAELKRWIETCRVKQQPLTSPMTKENMAPMYFTIHLIKA